MSSAYWVLGIAIVVLVFAAYMGMFTKLQIVERPFPGGYFVYYDYQGHINSVSLFHKNLLKSVGVDTSKLARMTITYDDPFNLTEARAFRASLGFLLKEYDAQLIEKFKKLHYEWKSLPSVASLSGDFPYRNEASLSFGTTRFLPTCLNYILRNSRRLKKVLQEKAGTIEVIENNNIAYYLVIEKQKEFHLSSFKQPELKNEDKLTTVFYNKKND